MIMQPAEEHHLEARLVRAMASSVKFLNRLRRI